MENLGLPKLTSEQIEELCSIVEEAARKHVLSKVPSKRIETLNIAVDVEGSEPLTLAVDVDVVLSPLMKNLDVKRLADDAMKEAFASAERYMRERKCRSKK